MLERMSIRPTRDRGHRAHEGRGDLVARRARDAHLATEVGGHAAAGNALLTLVKRHARTHRMAARHAWMLLHPVWVAEAGAHACHHVPDPLVDDPLGVDIDCRRVCGSTMRFLKFEGQRPVGRGLKMLIVAHERSGPGA